MLECRMGRRQTLLMRAAKNGALTKSEQIAVEEVDGIRFEYLSK
jgi:hypothetical protein